jgi:hypothetical protein
MMGEYAEYSIYPARAEKAAPDCSFEHQKGNSELSTPASSHTP